MTLPELAAPHTPPVVHLDSTAANPSFGLGEVRRGAVLELSVFSGEAGGFGLAETSRRVGYPCSGAGVAPSWAFGVLALASSPRQPGPVALI